ncbi:MAG: hypothetical protein J6E32_07170, partial [Lachnospiraceae bacterium]|nr:hypothetical protein [Lachnospiraceae bacterium]
RAAIARDAMIVKVQNLFFRIMKPPVIDVKPFGRFREKDMKSEQAERHTAAFLFRLQTEVLMCAGVQRRRNGD